jgi:teichuronic acid biosynthesis glycosyltransferase TuaH
MENVIITGIQPWDIEIGSNCKNIALEFSKTRKVLFVNPPLDRVTRYRKRNDLGVITRVKIIKSELNPFEYINENLVVFTPRIVIESNNWMPHFLFRIFNRINSIRLGGEILKATKELNFANYILFTDSDMFRSKFLKQLLKPKAFLYYSRDNLMTVPYWEKHGSIMEPEIISNADVVVTNSPHLAKIAKQYNNNSFYVGQGCDVDDYLLLGKTELPVDMKKLKGKIIGYTGLLSSRRLCIDIIAEIAKKLPEVSVVLVGPQEKCFASSELHDLNNIHFLGSKKPTELPNYINHFDVCINPQVVNELTKGNYPRKIDEYLAAGKKTVATRTPTMEVFKDYCELADSPGEFALKCKYLLSQEDDGLGENRRNFAASHSWGNSINQMLSVLNKTLKNIQHA